MTDTDAHILTTGGVIRDSVITADGRVSLEQMGGNAVYSAVGARLWSDRVALAGNIAANYPEALLDRLRAAGIGCDGIDRAPEEVSETEWFLNNADGSRVDHLYAPSQVFQAFGFAEPLDAEDRARFLSRLKTRTPEGLGFGALRQLYPVSVDQALRAAPGPRIVHLAPENLSAQAELIAAFRARGAILSLDPGSSGAQSPHEIETLAGQVDIFLPSQKELAAMRPGLSPAAALKDLGRTTSAVLAVKIGAEGALLLDRDTDRIVHVPALEVDAPDPVGAGDAFCGGFAAGYLAGRDVRHAAACGTVSASFAVGGFGALHALTATPDEIALRNRAIVFNTLPEFSR